MTKTIDQAVKEAVAEFAIHFGAKPEIMDFLELKLREAYDLALEQAKEAVKE